MPKILCIIPARAGSKRLANKNIKPFAGKPLIAWTIDAALGAQLDMDVVVSTDSKEIAEVSEAYGAEVPFLRPESLASDSATSFDTIKYTLTQLKTLGREYEILIFLQPTSPLRQSFHIENAYALLQQQNGKTVISVSEIDHPIEWTMSLPDTASMDDYINTHQDALMKRSQDFSTRYRVNGAIFCGNILDVFACQGFYLKSGGVFAYPMERKYSIDIDELIDFEYAEFLMFKFLSKI
ncbi:MAG: CMP-N,N'-diacetyllegionaminic acid synthase [Thiomicrorhabdus sp.]|nr:MAG: CMP-N,N'-diacetyllegionaminic acid synthase [Thiomicrorhabdus sp.]